MTRKEQIKAALTIRQRVVDLLANLEVEMVASDDKRHRVHRNRWPINWLSNVVNHMDLIVRAMREEDRPEL